jgi:uncharacterized protein involved in exopolysaccharide biosynthesis
MENARSLRDTIELLLRHRVLIAAVSCCAIVLATTVAMFQTQIYESSAVLLIKFGREMFSQIGDRETLVNRENAIINVEIQILRSEAVVEGTIEAVTVERLYPGLYANPPEGVPIDRVAASKFRRNFIVRAVPASDVLKVSFRHPDPEVAADTVNVLVDEFKRAHLIAFGQEKTTAFLNEQVESYRTELEQKEEEVQQFRAAHPAFSVQDPGALLMDQRTRFTSELDETRAQIAAIRRRLAAPSPVDTAERRSDRAELRARQGEQTQLVAKLEATEAELQALAGLQKEYRQLVRERDETEDLYRTYHKQLADARISNEMDRQQIANISVIQEGRVPLSPIRPKKMLYVAVGGTVGLVLGCLAAFLIESLRVAPASAAPSADRPSPLRLRRS